MFENVREGFLGFVLVVSNFFTTGEGDAGLGVRSVQLVDSAYVVECVMEVGWNDQLSELVDAGIPVRFRMSMTTDAPDTVAFVRTMSFDVAEDAYRYRDSSLAGGPDTAAASKDFPQILIGLRDMRKWSFAVSPQSRNGHIEVEILRSKVSRLNRTVDLTHVWGRKKIAVDIAIGDPVPDRKRRRDK